MTSDGHAHGGGHLKRLERIPSERFLGGFAVARLEPLSVGLQSARDAEIGNVGLILNVLLCWWNYQLIAIGVSAGRRNSEARRAVLEVAGIPEANGLLERDLCSDGVLCRYKLQQEVLQSPMFDFFFPKHCPSFTSTCSVRVNHHLDRVEL